MEETEFMNNMKETLDKIEEKLNEMILEHENNKRIRY